MGRSIPSTIFGVLAILAGLIVILLPETREQKLPDTLEEGELFGKWVKFEIDFHLVIVISIYRWLGLLVYQWLVHVITWDTPYRIVQLYNRRVCI